MNSSRVKEQRSGGKIITSKGKLHIKSIYKKSIFNKTNQFIISINKNYKINL
jgi:hypothetical protein